MSLASASNITRIDGATSQDEVGRYALAAAGDVNGDGRPDLLVGAWQADNNSRSNSGSAYVVFGQASATSIDLGSLGTKGYRIDGAVAGEGAGVSVASAGDVNGDGTPDQIIGAHLSDRNSRTDSGSAYVVFGKSTTTAIDLNALGSGGYRIDGATAGEQAGMAVAGVGDVNGDGTPDQAIGARLADRNSRTDSGSAYVVFGKSGTTAIDLNALGSGGFRIDGATAGEQAGSAVSGAGDLTGDGKADVLVSAPLADQNSRTDSGSVYAVFGTASTSAVDLASLGSGGYRVDGQAAGDQLGLYPASVAGGTDLNADGTPDMVLGAPYADNNSRSDSGSAFVVWGKSSTSAINLSSLGTGGFRVDGRASSDWTGQSVGWAADLNGDGLPEVLVGAPKSRAGGSNDQGSAYVVLGKTSTSAVDANSLSTAGWRIDGTGGGVLLGSSVAAPGDVDGDGRPDVAVAAYQEGQNSRGTSGSVFSASVTQALPLATTSAATSVASTSATAPGTVNPEGQSTTWVVQYGTTTAYGSTTSSTSAGSGSSASAVSASLTGLSASTTYHFRVVATNAAGYAHYGVDRSFTTSAAADTTPPTAPTVAGGSLSWQSVASVAVSASGSADSGGSGLSGYEYRTSADGGSTWGASASGSSVTVSAEGETLVQFRALDVAGNASSWTPASSSAGSTVRLDRTAPATPAVAGGSLSWQSVASITITGSGATDSGGSGLAGYEHRASTDGGTTWGASAPGATATASAEGETLVEFRALDTAGNASAWTVVGTFTPVAGATARIDRSAPAAPTIAGGSLSWQSPASVAVSASGSTDSGGSGLSGYEYRASTDGGSTWGASASGSSVTVSAEGETLVQFRALDVAGNASSWTPASSSAGSTVRLDRTTPSVPTVSSGSSSWQSVASVTLTGSGSTDSGGSGLSGYEYRTSTDGGSTWGASASGASATVSAQGETLVEFRALDAAGNVSAWTTVSAASTARLDRTAPSVPTVSGGSSSWQAVASVDVAGSGSADAASGVASYEHRTSTDGGATWGAAAPGATVTVSAEGETLVELRAVDGAGNVSAWTAVSAASTARLDRTAPSMPIVSGGSASWQSVASVDVTASAGADSASGVASYEHRVSTDGGATWGAAASGATVAVSAEGETLVEARAVDTAGNASAWTAVSAASTVRLDRTAPSVPTVSGGSVSWQAVASVDVTGAGSADAASGVASYEHRVSTDGGTTWGAVASGATATVSAEGETLVEARAVDTAGNASAWTAVSAASTVRLDRTAPSVPTVSGGSVSWQAVASVDVTASGSADAASGLASYEHRLSTDAGATWSAPAAGATATVSAEGETLVAVRAVDAVGNASTWTTPGAGATVRLDRTGPSVPTVAGGAAAWSSSATVTLTASGASDAAGAVTYEHRASTDGGATWGAATAGASLGVSAEGETLAQFRAVDPIGNVSGWSAVDDGATVRIDRTAPSVPTVSGGSGSWQAVASVDVTGGGGTDAASGLASYEHRTSADAGATWGPATPGGTVTVSAEGETLVAVRAVDAAGNASAWSTPDADATVRIDRSGPSAPAVTGGSASWLSVASIDLTGAGSADAASGVASYEHRASTDGGATWSAPGAGATVTVSAEGETLAAVRAIDAAGNVSAWSPAAAGATARIDRTDPPAPAASGGSLLWRSVASVDVTASSAADPLSGVASYEHRVSADGGATWGATVPGGTATVSAEGERVVAFRAVDGAGNTSAWSAADAGATVRIDRTVPAVPVASGGSLVWGAGASVTVTASGGDDALSGNAGYESRASTDGGATWGAVTPGTTVTVSDEGETLVAFRSVDAAGNASAWATPGAGGTVRIDRTGPSIPSASGGSASWTSAASVTVTGSGATDGAGAVTYQHRTSTDGGSTWSSAVAGPSVAVTAPGETLAQFRAVDAIGNVSDWSAVGDGATVRIDRTAPTAPAVTGGSAAWQDVPSVDVTGSGASDAGGSGLAGYEWRTSGDGGATWSAAAWGATATVLSEGETLVQLRASDGAGNVSAWTPAARADAATVRIDRTGPTAPAVSGGSLAWTGAPSVEVTASGATDAAGPVTYEHRLSTDGGATWDAAAPGGVVAVTGPGETLVQMRAVDPVGNVSAWAGAPGAGGTARIDRTDPSVPVVTGGSAAWSSAASVDVTASGATDAGGAGLAGYEHRVSSDGGGSWGSAAPGAVATVSAEGETLVRFRAVDAAGNASAWSTVDTGTTVRLDRTAPSGLTVSGGSLSWQSVPSVVVTAAGAADPASGLASYEHRISTDGAATWGAAAPGATVTASAEGETLAQFRAVDAAGNATPWEPAHSPALAAVATARIDRTAPPAPVLLAAAGSPTLTPPALTWTAAPGATSYHLRRDGVTVATMTGTAGTDTGAPAGTHVYTVTALDAAGNEGPESPSATVVYDPAPDVTPPETRIDQAPSGLTNLASPVVRFSDDGTGNGFSCQIDGGAWTACASPATLGPLADGPHVLRVRARDAAGNVDPTPAERTFTVDSSIPGTPGAPSGSGLPVEISWPSVPRAARYELAYQGRVIASPLTPGAVWWDARDGVAPPAPGGLRARDVADGALLLAWDDVADAGVDYPLTVRAVGASGGAGPWSAPGLVTARAGLQEYRVLVDGAEVGSARLARLTIDGLSSTPHRLQVVAVDRAGNVSPPSIPLDIAPGTTPSGAPSSVRLSVPSTVLYVRPGSQVVIPANVQGAGAGAVRWTLSDGTETTGAALVRRFRGTGVQAVRAEVFGRDGSRAGVVVNVMVDGRRPSLRVRRTGGRLRITARDAESGIARVEVRADRGPWRPVRGGAVRIPPRAATVRVRVTDRAGNARAVGLRLR